MGSTEKYRPDIDGLRAIAVLAVVAYHAAPGRLPGGFIGVDVFFVISGFLITSILHNSLDKGKFSILEFYERRIRRIFPALFVVLFTCAVAGWFFLLPSEYQQLGKHIAAGTAFVSNFALWNESGYFDISAMFKPLLHLWSLGIEEQFYIFWPLILWFAYKKKWSLPLTISLLAIASFILNIYLSDTDKSSAFYSPFPRFWELLVGALLACTIAAHKKFDSPALGNAQSILGLILLAAGFFLITEKGAFPGWWVLMPVMGSALMISAGPQALFNRWILSNRLMVWVGLISYPLYLWHWPLLSFPRLMEGQEIPQINRAIAVAIAFLLAWLTYQFIEKPVRQAPHSRLLVYVLLCLLAAIGIFGAVAYMTHGFKDRTGNLPKQVNSGDIGQDIYLNYIRDKYHVCQHLSVSDRHSTDIPCYQTKLNAKQSIALIGDSHAEHLLIGLSAALPNENIVYSFTHDLPTSGNRELEPAFKNILKSGSIKIVIINAYWVNKLDDPRFSNWRRDLRSTVKELTDAGKVVYIVDDVPLFSFSPSRCKFSGRLGIENKCSETDKQSILNFGPEFENISANNPNAHVLRTYDMFCQNKRCSMADAGELYFRDEHHLNVQGSKKVGVAIGRQIMSFSEKAGK